MFAGAEKQSTFINIVSDYFHSSRSRKRNLSTERNFSSAPLEGQYEASVLLLPLKLHFSLSLSLPQVENDADVRRFLGWIPSPLLLEWLATKVLLTLLLILCSVLATSRTVNILKNVLLATIFRLGSHEMLGQNAVGYFTVSWAVLMQETGLIQ